MYNNIEVDVLINGASVAKYNKDGKVYVEAKDGSEYEIRIKNNNCHRVLAVCSVDGLDVLTGKPAGLDGGGYIIAAYNSYRIKGYRYNNDNVGAFKFSKKEKSYAASKSKKLAQNCGVIGICVYGEKVNNWFESTNTDNDIWNKPITTPSIPMPYPTDPWKPYTPKPLWRDNDMTYGSSTNDVISCNFVMSCNKPVKRAVCDLSAIKEDSFDMGSTWGNNKESKVTETTFERGEIVFSGEIYYASRNSLLEMGVIEENKPKVAFPKSFPKGYATPPEGWNG